MANQYHNIAHLNQQITNTKNRILQTQCQLMSHKYTHPKTPSKQSASKQPTSKQSPNKSQFLLTNTTQLSLSQYLMGSVRIRQLLEEKMQLVELNSQKQIIHLQHQINTLQQQLNQQTIRISNQQATINNFHNMQESLKASKHQIEQDSKYIRKINQDNNIYKQQNTQLKLENKSLRADNKIITKHLDKFTSQKQDHHTPSKVFEQRQIKVIQSLYNKNLPQIQSPKASNNHQENQLTNKVKLENSQQVNNNLRNQISHLQQQIQIHRQQINLYKQEISILKQKIINYQSIVKLSKQLKQKQILVENTLEIRLQEVIKQNNHLKEQIKNIKDQKKLITKKFLSLRPGLIYSFN